MLIILSALSMLSFLMHYQSFKELKHLKALSRSELIASLHSLFSRVEPLLTQQGLIHH